MATQTDYVTALIIFLASFAVIMSSVLAYTDSYAESWEKNAMNSYAQSLLKIAEKEWSSGKIGTKGIGTRAYFFELTIAGDGAVEIFFSNISIPIDKNSLAIYRKGLFGSSSGYSLSADKASFAANGSSEFVIWFDDDSSFPSRSENLPDLQVVESTTWPVEGRWILSYSAMQKLASEDYIATKEIYHFRVSVIDSNQNLFFNYGLEPQGETVSARRHVLFQKENADVERGELVVDVWD
ncbi:MAG: hypothetical protein HYW25_01855 [Candidatus Aenigmarchaeota archaeon]|nr:hypothetical protein [Candidatus Aenigmarchaeota archaeon]